MKQCITTSKHCLGRDTRELSTQCNIQLCCRDEIKEEKEIVQNIIDTIDYCSRDISGLLRISSKFSYGSTVINSNKDECLAEVLSVVRRFSLLMYEFQDKIIHDSTIGDLSFSFISELQRWFAHQFLDTTDPTIFPVQRESILSDINTIEMALGVCLIQNTHDSLDDLFF